MANPVPRMPPRHVDEGEWTAVPHVTLPMAIIATAASILMGWGAWNLACLVWDWFVRLALS